MLRIPVLAIFAALALPTAANASVIPSISGDTLTVTGDGAADSITVRALSDSTLDVNGFDFDRATFSTIAIRSGAGADTIRIADALSEPVTIESGPGADTVLGGPGAETIAAGADADAVHPGGGDDTVLLGSGDDSLVQGDGFDQVDGETGTDTLRAVGTGESEEFTLQRNGAKLRVARDTGPTTDAAAFEALDVNAAGGPDLIDVGDLGPTGIRDLSADLGFLDGARDQIHVQGTDAQDIIDIRPSGGLLLVDRLAARIQVENAGASDDRLTVFGRGGLDLVDASNDAGTMIALTLDGGPGGDVIDGSDAADTLLGGPDGDVITGGKGSDTADMGDGNDFFIRGRVDGHDRVEGGAGIDQITAFGTAEDESIDIQGLLARTRVLFGFVGEADMGGVERVSVNPQAGTDFVTVRDLSGTATDTVNLQLNTPDLRTDTVTVTGTHGNDAIKAATTADTHVVSGLPATVNVQNPERGQKLVIDARDGDDTVDATAIARDTVQPALKGGAGKDTIIGSPSDDVIAGGTGVDIALMGGGLDTFTWGPGEGSDIVEGQAGTDFLQMNGSGGNDRFDVQPIGSRTRVTRDIDNVNLDLGGVERVDILPGPGGDILRVADLSGTATDHVDFNLAVARGQIGGDNLIDRVFIDGTFGNDTINVNGAGPDVRTTGLAAITTVRGTDPELDRLHLDTKPGLDALTVTGTTNQLIGFTHS